MKLTQYKPSFIETSERELIHFDNSEELLNIEWVKRFAQNDGFHQFSLSRDNSGILEIPAHRLVAEYKNGTDWLVVAHIRDKDISGIDDLPELIL